MSSNLPTGVTENMIPGNRPEDMEWEQVHENIDWCAEYYSLSATDAHMIWNMGLAAYTAMNDTRDEQS